MTRDEEVAALIEAQRRDDVAYQPPEFVADGFRATVSFDVLVERRGHDNVTRHVSRRRVRAPLDLRAPAGCAKHGMAEWSYGRNGAHGWCRRCKRGGLDPRQRWERRGCQRHGLGEWVAAGKPYCRACKRDAAARRRAAA